MEELNVDSGSSSAETARKFLSAFGVVAVLVAAVVGGNAFGLRERLFGSVIPEPRPAAGAREATSGILGDETVLRSQPWWQTVKRVEGQGSEVIPDLQIDEFAIQWRVIVSCDDGELAVATPGEAEPLIESSCAGTETGYGVKPGSIDLDVRTEGSWELHVEQQIDVPLEEPPLPAMEAPDTEHVASARLYRIERSTQGRLELYRFKDGRYALRLDDFYVTPNVDLEIRFSKLEAPKTTPQFTAAPSAFVAPLDITAGSLNFLVPRDVDPTIYRSVVIWCPPLRIAYAGATLRLPG